MSLFARVKKTVWIVWKMGLGILFPITSLALVWLILSAYFEESTEIRYGSWHFNKEGIFGLPAYEFRPTDLGHPFISIACFDETEYRINFIHPTNLSSPRLSYLILEPNPSVEASGFFREPQVLHEGRFFLREDEQVNIKSHPYLRNFSSPSTSIYEIEAEFKTEFINTLNAAEGQSWLAIESITEMNDFEFGWHEIGSQLSGACNETTKEKVALGDFWFLGFILSLIFSFAYLLYVTQFVLDKILYVSIILPLLSYTVVQIIILRPLIYSMF